ncbi:MAG: hypothetical protein QOI66_178, partial [Myxococcales bacterium]|nr:hypothetical protein [Myxococcales bacterium]
MNAAVRKGLSVARLLTAISVTGLDCGGAETFRGDVVARTPDDGIGGSGGDDGQPVDATAGGDDTAADMGVGPSGEGGTGGSADAGLMGSGGIGGRSDGSVGTGGAGSGGTIGTGGSS